MSIAPASAHEGLAFNQYPLPGGASVAEVNGIAEDREGAIWVATWGEGVHRIQGTEWRTYTEADGIPDNWVRSICASAGGGVWIGTGEGMARVRDGRVEALTPADLPLMSNPDVFYIRELSDGEVWAGTRGGWVLVRDADPTGTTDLSAGWRIAAGPDETQGQPIYQVLETGPGERLISTAGKGLSRVRDSHWEKVTLPGPGDWFSLFSRSEGGKIEIWAAAYDRGGLYRHTISGWSGMESAPEEVNELAADAGGTIYAATAWGLFAFRDGAWSPVDLPQTLGAPALRRVLVARDGAVWLGGSEGLFRGAKHAWTPAPPHATGLAVLARSGTEDPVLALNAAGEVFRFDGSWQPAFRLEPWVDDAWRPDDSIWLGDGQVWESLQSGSQWLWVARNRLWRVHNGDFRVYALDSGRLLKHESLTPMEDHGAHFALTTDGRLWALTEGPMLQREGDAWRPYPDYPGYAHRRVLAVRETEPGVFWAGVQGGLERWTARGVECFGQGDGVGEDDGIYAILKARSGELWFGSMGSGLYRYDGVSFQQYTKADGLYSNAIRGLYESEDGHIWVSYRGIGLSTLRDGRWVHFTNQHGLPNATILGMAETGRGGYWATANGPRLYQYRPDELPPDTAIVLGPREIDSHGVGVFSFTGRDAWNQTPARDLFYAWRITPLEEVGAAAPPWSRYSGVTTVASGPLRHGLYQFEVRSSDGNGNADPSPATLLVAVAPPLWMKPAFLIPVLLSLVLAAAAMAFRHLSHQALLRSEAALRDEVEVRKETETLLARHRDNLEALVEERTCALERAQEALLRKERLATLGQLTATVSHELRNPLGTLQSSLFVIKKRLGDPGANLDGAIERMERSIRRCDHIVEEMLDYTRTHDFELRTVELDPWLREAVQDIEVPEAVEIKLNLHAGAWVRIDDDLMRRVLINLTDNAVEAMNSRNTPAKQLRITSACSGGRAVVRVEDTGPGIPPENLPHIFEPLFSTKNFGIGLGTNIVRNILERHEGGIEYTNIPDGGACAILWLPAAQAPTASGTQP